MKDHDSGAKEQAEDGGAGGKGANVVPFPRSWYGSVDELIPIEPGPPPGAVRESSLTDASAFWGGDATQSDEASKASLGVSEDDRGVDSFEPELSADESPISSYAAPRVERRPTGRGWSASTFVLALIVLLAGVAALAVLSIRGTTGQADPSKSAREPALTVTQSIPQTTTVVQTVTTRKTRPVRSRPAVHHYRPPEQHSSSVTDAVSQAHPTESTVPVIESPPSSHQSSSSSGASTGKSGANATPPARVRSSAPTAGSSKPSCAPSVTNGGGCSL